MRLTCQILLHLTRLLHLRHSALWGYRYAVLNKHASMLCAMMLSSIALMKLQSWKSPAACSKQRQPRSPTTRVLLLVYVKDVGVSNLRIVSLDLTPTCHKDKLTRN